MTDLRVELARQPFATLKDFDGANRLSCNLTGTIRAGNTQLTIQGFGPSGARLVWRLSTEKVMITAVRPNPFSLVDKVTIKGKNFSEHVADTKVLIASKTVKVTAHVAPKLS